MFQQILKASEHSMRHFTVFTAIAFLLFMPQAKAGFEWLPPSQNPAPVAVPQHHDTAVHPIEPVVAGGMTGAVPSMPVMAEPLDPMAPASILPQAQTTTPGKLYINPYPLRQFDPMEAYAQQTGTPVEQAMVEESRMLNPLQLGAGMKTGAQPQNPPVPTAYTASSIGSSPFESMTPMMGEEPARMPRGPMMDTPPPGYYAEAVGFGNDLPLALALSQVVPPTFTHSYAEGVQPGVTVSWQGGKPWNQVLDDMLRPHGLMAIVSGSRVSIQPRARS